MDGLGTAFGSGLLLGLAGSLHCAAMCGGLACSATLAAGRTTIAGRLATLGLVHAGRTISYVALGVAAAGIGAVANPIEAGQGLRLAQAGSAAVLLWSALSTMGALPRVRLVDGAVMSASTLLDRQLAPLRRVPWARDVALGLVLGIAACPMMYAAVMVAALTGSPANAALHMLGFASATGLSVIGAAVGWTSLTAFTARHRSLQGLGIVLLAAAALLPFAAGLPLPGWICRTPAN
jgi:sulfite exporter TauE/SafE